MTDFIDGLPKSELHVHLEGTFEPELQQAIGERNGLGEAAARRAGEFGTLATFLGDYYAAMAVLREEQDFADLTAAYLGRAAQQGVRYCEMFFDPQAHTARGVPLEVVLDGIHAAQLEAGRSGGTRSRLILCFLRDQSVESAMETLEAALPHRDRIVGVGLDSDERGNPPAKFAEVFRRARREGFRLTMHCDPRQDDSLEHVRQCLELIGVDRIDHGVSVLEDAEVCDEIRNRGIGLTVCPLSNLRIYGDLMAGSVAELLASGINVTCNSDDPAYFGGYAADNYRALAGSGLVDRDGLVQLARNSFEVAWLEPPERAGYLAELDAYIEAW